MSSFWLLGIKPQWAELAYRCLLVCAHEHIHAYTCVYIPGMQVEDRRQPSGSWFSSSPMWIQEMKLMSQPHWQEAFLSLLCSPLGTLKINNCQMIWSWTISTQMVIWSDLTYLHLVIMTSKTKLLYFTITSTQQQINILDNCIIPWISAILFYIWNMHLGNFFMFIDFIL